MRSSEMIAFGSAAPHKVLRLIKGDAAALVLRQLFVAALFFLSNLVLMGRIRGNEFAAFVDAQNAAYLLIAVVVGGLQPTLMYFSIRNDRKVSAVLKLAVMITAVGLLVVAAGAYVLAQRGGVAFVPAFVLAVGLLISSTFPYFLLAAGRISLFSALEVIPNALFLTLALLTSSSTTSVDLILIFAGGHVLKSVICLIIIVRLARAEEAAAIENGAFLRYFISSGVIGIGHAAIQRMPPLLISNFFPPMVRVAVLSGWVLLDRSLAIQQSINLWLFQKNASGGLNRSSLIRIIGLTAGIALALPLVLSAVIAVAMKLGVRSEYHDAPLAILAMAPAFMFACLRTSLQAIGMSDGRNQVVIANVVVTALLMASLFSLRDPGILAVSLWITAALALSTIWYVILEFRRR